MRIQQIIIALAIAALSACRHRDDKMANGSAVHVQSAGVAAAQTLGDGDVRIVTMDDGMDMALIGDTISSGLSPDVLAKAVKETDTNAVTGSGFGASIEKMVKSKVQGAIGTRMVLPVNSITDATYTNGKITFIAPNQSKDPFEHVKASNKPLLESFSAADAQRLVNAVHDRIAKRTAH